MAVKMRLRRMGQKKAPFYRIIIADERSPRDGRFIAEIGLYDPTKEPSLIKFDEEEAKKWLKNGVQPTPLKLSVAEADMGRVIGKGGRIAKSIRAVLRAASARQSKHIILDID